MNNMYNMIFNGDMMSVSTADKRASTRFSNFFLVYFVWLILYSMSIIVIDITWPDRMNVSNVDSPKVWTVKDEKHDTTFKMKSKPLHGWRFFFIFVRCLSILEVWKNDINRNGGSTSERNTWKTTDWDTVNKKKK